MAHSFHMSIMVLIMCAYIVPSNPSMSTNLHASCVLHVIMIAKTIFYIMLAHWLVTLCTPCHLNFCRDDILTLAEVTKLRLLLPGLKFVQFALKQRPLRVGGHWMPYSPTLLVMYTPCIKFLYVHGCFKQN